MSWIWDEQKGTYVYVPAAGKGGTDYTQDPSYQNVTVILQNANKAFQQHLALVKENKAEYDPNFMKQYEAQIAVADSINSEIKAKYDSALAQETKGANAAATAARKAEADRVKAIETARARAAGESSATFLESSAATQKATADKRIEDLYGGLETSAKERLDLMLKQLETDTGTAQKAITGAGEQYTKSFKPSVGYTAPVTKLDVAQSPLLAALQQQGAGTEEVQAATNLAQQTAGATSDLQKWAMGQLNVGQQNYEAGMQNVNAQALQAALQNLATKKSQVGTSFQSDYQTQLDKIKSDAAAAQGTSDAEIQKLINEAAKIRATTILETGPTPVAGSKDARTQAVATAPSQYANFKEAVKALNPNFDAKKTGKTAEQAFPALAKAFGKKTK
jgi:uncharacterized protein YicC (UPF0701 family)